MALTQSQAIIIDTDIGDDIDDAFALALAVKLTNLTIIGITTVYKNTVLRGRLVKHLLMTLGKGHIPVHAGLAMPIKEPLAYYGNDIPTVSGMDIPCQYDPTTDDYPIDGENGVDFIIENALLLNGDLVLVPIGPLTNIAMAIQKAPAIKAKIKRIVMMGGWVENPTTPEWNFRCDPEAAAVVLQSGIPIDCMGLDVTRQCGFEETLLNRLRDRTDDTSRLLSTWFKRWSDRHQFTKSMLHDPLAIATLAVDNICGFTPMPIQVDLTHHRGATLVKSSPKTPLINIATTVNKNLFFQLFSSRLF
jgi:inosine-uridine nucleoside N-ribohydrolase